MVRFDPEKIPLSEVALYMRMGRREPDEPLASRIRALASSAPFAPKCVWRRFALEEFGSGHPLACVKRLKVLEGCTDAILLAATLGAAFDAWQRRLSVKSGADALIAQAVGAAAIETYLDAVEDDIRGELKTGEGLRNRFSPGFVDDFPLSNQPDILALLDAPRMIGVAATESFLLVPSKSVTAVIGIDNGGTAK